jgi:hypothetical protein
MAYQATAAEVDKALGAGQVEAWSTSLLARENPSMMPTRVQDAFSRGVSLDADGTARTPSGWPADVSSVQYISTTRAAADEFMDGSTTDSDQDVVLVRLAGHFAVATSGPGNAVAKGTIETIVVDPATGNVLDFGLATSPKPLPNPVVVIG